MDVGAGGRSGRTGTTAQDPMGPLIVPQGGGAFLFFRRVPAASVQ